MRSPYTTFATCYVTGIRLGPGFLDSRVEDTGWTGQSWSLCCRQYVRWSENAWRLEHSCWTDHSPRIARRDGSVRLVRGIMMAHTRESGEQRLGWMAGQPTARGVVGRRLLLPRQLGRMQRDGRHTRHMMVRASRFCVGKECLSGQAQPTSLVSAALLHRLKQLRQTRQQKRSYSGQVASHAGYIAVYHVRWPTLGCQALVLSGPAYPRTTLPRR